MAYGSKIFIGHVANIHVNQTAEALAVAVASITVGATPCMLHIGFQRASTAFSKHRIGSAGIAALDTRSQSRSQSWSRSRNRSRRRCALVLHLTFWGETRHPFARVCIGCSSLKLLCTIHLIRCPSIAVGLSSVCRTRFFSTGTRRSTSGRHSGAGDCEGEQHGFGSADQPGPVGPPGVGCPPPLYYSRGRSRGSPTACTDCTPGLPCRRLR